MNKEEIRKRARIYYYKNRSKKLNYQREYDKTHREIKREYDKKRRKLKNYLFIKKMQHHSQKHHFKILSERYNGCEICNSKHKLEIHHKRYTKNIKDVMFLCQECHKKIHRKPI